MRPTMTDEVQSVLEHLKAIRGDMADVRRDVRDIKARLSSLENQVVQMHKSGKRLAAAS